MENVMAGRFAFCIAFLALSATEQVRADSLLDCFRYVATDPQYADIAGKLPLKDLTAISVVMLADQTHPTPKQRTELASWFDERDRCWANSDERARWQPELVQIGQEGSTRFKAIGADLYSGKLTFGGANKQIAELRDSIQARITSLVSQYRAAAKAAADQKQHEEEQEERQLEETSARRAAQERAEENEQTYQEQMLRLQRAQALMNAFPTITNCNAMGSSVTCYSH
jgi:hypothetical protein